MSLLHLTYIIKKKNALVIYTVIVTFEHTFWQIVHKSTCKSMNEWTFTKYSTLVSLSSIIFDLTNQSLNLTPLCWRELYCIWNQVVSLWSILSFWISVGLDLIYCNKCVQICSVHQYLFCVKMKLYVVNIFSHLKLFMRFINKCLWINIKTIVNYFLFLL